MAVKQDMDIALHLIRARQKLGISQARLAQGLGVSFATVNRWENGRTKPSKLASARIQAFLSEMTQNKN